MELKLYFSEEEMSLFLTNLGYTIENYEYSDIFETQAFKATAAYKKRPYPASVVSLAAWDIKRVFTYEMKLKLLAL